MIYSIKADQSSFKPVYFKPGFNVVLAERTKESAAKDSRNGLGKSTLIEVIHFCLGGDKADTLKKQQLDDWTFTIEIDLAGKKYFVSRNTSNTGKIYINGDCSNWLIKPDVDEKTGNQIFSRNDWNKSLGVLLFGLQPIYDGYKYHPTFRSLISYFVRRNVAIGSFLNPFQQFKSQSEWDKQVNNTFLLGLGWEYAAKWQVLKDRESVISQLKAEASSGFISNLMGNVGELEAARIKLSAQVKQEHVNLNSFKVHPQYNSLEEMADELTERIHENINRKITEKRTLDYYQESLTDEVDTDPNQVQRIYQEAGLTFPESIKKRIQEVLEFHKRVVVNRKEFLKTEIERLDESIGIREQEIIDDTDKRAELLQTLKTNGSLQEYVKLQDEHQKTVSNLKEVSQRLENLKKFEQGKSSLIVEQELLQQQAKSDFGERKIQREEAILAFNAYSKELYKASGTLSINISKTGYKFEVDIERSGSHGYGNMKIFCYDLMLSKLWSKRTKKSLFLIHDSTIFADVDERQKALSLQLAESESRKNNIQYICTMNSDSIPYEDFDKDFDIQKYVVKTLTDKTVDGSLLGIRF